MKIILKKVRKKTLFSTLDPIKVEPLELEYLYSVIMDLECHVTIVDGLFDKRKYPGDIVVLNGYNTARDKMIEEAVAIKKRDETTLVIGTGIDVQVNWKYYQEGIFDYLVVSNKLSVFRMLIEGLIHGSPIELEGVQKRVNGRWQIRSSTALENYEIMLPDRQYFHQIKHKTRYLLYENVALVKSAHSCPYNCDYCFCKQLNQGNYVTRSFDKISEELKNISCDYVWIVDDILLNSVEEVASFVKVFQDQTYKFIIYLRADFIASNKSLIADLKKCGVTEVIIGLESIKSEALEDYKKGYEPEINTKAIQVLNQVDVSFTALFMVHPNDSIEDFTALKSYIKSQRINNYTFSIYTPLKGTSAYTRDAANITDDDCQHYDFLHLVMGTGQMSAFRFKLAFWSLFVFQFFNSKSARQFVYRFIRNIVRRSSYES